MFPLTDPILVFSLLIFVILICPLLAGKFRVPDLVLLLLAGVLLGPKGFGVLERSSAVILLGSVGLLYIMFVAGLEIDLHDFRRTGQRSIVFGLLTFIFPQTLGSLAGRYVLGFSWPTSILLASMFASHTLLAYPIASRLGISKSEPVTITVGATIITDTMALIVLAVIADMARGMDLNIMFWVNISAGLLILVLVIWQGVPRLSRWFFNKVTEEGNAQFLFVLAVVCCCSYFSHLAKMEPIIGAFLAGVAFNRLIPANSVLMNRVVFAGDTLFIPFFLISVGMLVDPVRVVMDPRCWLVAAVMIVMVIATKYAASWLAGTLFGYRPEERKVMFGLSVVQAAATLAAVMVGYDLGVLDDTVLNGAIAMIAVSAPLGAWVVDRQGRKLAVRAEARPAPLTAEQRLLVLVANPVSAARVLDLALLLRDTERPGAIHPITIVRDEGDTEEAVARGEKLLAYCLTHAASADIPVEPSVRVDVNVSDAIIRAAKALRSTTVLAGWHEAPPHRGSLLGPIMQRLIAACPSRLFVCRLNRPLNTCRRLVLLLPPLAERRRDLSALLRDVKHLSRQTGTDICAYLAGTDTSKLRRKLESTRPQRPVKIIEKSSMAEARAGLLKDIGGDDILMLPCERSSSALWTPVQEKMWELLYSSFPDNNLILLYPGLAATEDYILPELADANIPSFQSRSLDLDGGIGLEQVLRRMAGAALPENSGAADKAADLLLSAAKGYQVELVPEIVLLHAHCEALNHPVLVVGRVGGDLKLPETGLSPKVILVLLSPATSSPARHLKALAALGRRFHDASAVERIRKAETAAEIAEIIGEK